MSGAARRDGVRIVEVAARDGLQNEKAMVPTAAKVALIDALTACGFPEIEAASFVSPRWVPQMADGAQVMDAIARAPGVLYTVLVPNMKGYEAARAAGADSIAVFAAATEGFSRANVGASVAESFERMMPIVEAALSQGVAVRGYVSCVTDCPYDGPTPPAAVARAAAALHRAGCREVSLGDTIGKGTPETIRAMLEAVLAEVPAERLAGHYHDTGGRALDNVEASLALGLRSFDSSAGGLGGCPYAPGASGNVDSLALVERLEALGLATGIDRARLAEAARFARSLRSAA